MCQTKQYLKSAKVYMLNMYTWSYAYIDAYVSTPIIYCTSDCVHFLWYVCPTRFGSYQTIKFVIKSRVAKSIEEASRAEQNSL